MLWTAKATEVLGGCSGYFGCSGGCGGGWGDGCCLIVWCISFKRSGDRLTDRQTDISWAAFAVEKSDRQIDWQTCAFLFYLG